MINEGLFFDEAALLDRLSVGITKANEEVVLLVGAPLSAPTRAGEPGVPNVQGMIELIRNEFGGDSAEFDRAVSDAGEGKYQAAFRFLQGRRGQQAANNIVRQAVLASRAVPPTDVPQSWQGNEEFCRFLEADFNGWVLPKGMASLGRLLAGYPARFGRTILTTNFDPLIETSIRQVGGGFFRRLSS